MDARENYEVLRAGTRLLNFAARLDIADERLNEAAALCLSAAPVPGDLMVAFAQERARIQEVIGELREVARALGKTAMREARKERAARRTQQVAL
jgi:hypothetical protein